MSKRPAKYSENEIANGLAALALFSGSSTKAARALKQQGMEIPAATLRSWKQRLPEKYQRAQAEVNERIWANVGDAWRAVIQDATKATAEAVAKARTAIAKGDAKQATAYANAAKSLSLAGAISTDKSGAIDGRATQRTVVEERSLTQVFQQILANPKFAQIVKVNPDLLESTAEEE
jgi:hypothetical protein